MKKFLVAILIFVLAFSALAVCCFDSNRQFVYAEEVSDTTVAEDVDNNDLDGDGLDDYFGLPVELKAQLYGSALTYEYGGNTVYLYALAIGGVPMGVRMTGYYFGRSGIEVSVEVYTSDSLPIDFAITSRKYAATTEEDQPPKQLLTDKQLETRDTLIELFGKINQMIIDVDNVATTTYDGVFNATYDEETDEDVAGVVSDVYSYNAAHYGETIAISRYTYEMLTLSRQMYNATDGAFNPAVYRLVDLWGFSSRRMNYYNHQTYDRDTLYELPDQKYVKAFSQPSFTDFSEDAVKLTDNGDGTYSITKNVAPVEVDGEKFEQWLDLGGVAKGYVADKAREYIKELGIDRFYINAGGSSINSGDDVASVVDEKGKVIGFESKTTRIAVDNSFQIYTSLFEVDIGKSSVSTSGQYNRKLTIDGVEYAHILDGVTGAPAQTGVRAVTVVVPEELGAYWATMGDCLTTALTVLGRDGIVQLANSSFVKENNIKFVVQYKTIDNKQQLLSNYDPNELEGIGSNYEKFGWALKIGADGNFYYDAEADFTNSQQTYVVWIAVLGSLLGVAAVGLVVYHFVCGKKRALTNVLYAKKDKPFKPLDVMMYLGVLLVIVVLLFVFVFDTGNTQVQMITVIDMESGETLFMYNVVRNEYLANDNNVAGWKIDVDTHDGIIVTLSRVIDGEQQYNVMKITRGAPSVKMIDATCSSHQDCVHNFPAITRSGGAIVCSPHRLKIITA